MTSPDCTIPKVEIPLDFVRIMERHLSQSGDAMDSAQTCVPGREDAEGGGTYSDHAKAQVHWIHDIVPRAGQCGLPEVHSYNLELNCGFRVMFTYS